MGQKKQSVSAAGFLFMTRKRKNIAVPFLKKFSYLILLLVVVALGGFFWWRWVSAPAGYPPGQSQIFVIKKGEGLSSIAHRLDEEGLVKSALAFKLLVLTQGMSGQIQAGDFRVNSSWTTTEVAQLLTHGSLDLWLTFPEGWRREELGRRLAANLQDFSYPQFLDLTKNKEGQLFPDTYLVPRDASPSAAVGILTRNFEKKYSLELQLAAQKNGLTQNQVLTLASMVERESNNDQDSPIMADIMLKRWRQNWPLQIDATVQYALATRRNEGARDWLKIEWWPQKLSKQDLEVNSAYNTYLHRGLPPGPICNPGLSAIKAVIYPQETDYWFYLSDRQGKTHYAKTLKEHNENVVRYLQ